MTAIYPRSLGDVVRLLTATAAFAAVSVVHEVMKRFN
jgi:hypothetical protein